MVLSISQSRLTQEHCAEQSRAEPGWVVAALWFRALGGAVSTAESCRRMP